MTGPDLVVVAVGTVAGSVTGALEAVSIEDPVERAEYRQALREWFEWNKAVYDRRSPSPSERDEELERRWQP